MFYFQLKFDNYQNTVLHINNVGVKRKSYRKYHAIFAVFSSYVYGSTQVF